MSERPVPVLVSDAAADDRKRLKVLIGVAVALVLAVVVLPKFVLGGGGSDQVEDQIDLGGPSAGTTLAAPEAPSGAGDADVPRRHYSSRDPFIALVAATATEPDPAATEASTSGEAVPIVPEGTTIDSSIILPPEPEDDEDVVAPPTTVAPPPPPSSYRFSVLEVVQALDGRTMARVRVDDAVMDVIPVQDFAGAFRVLQLDLDAGCGRFLYGDAPFTLCEGQEIQT